jgi:hypothetical protein
MYLAAKTSEVILRPVLTSCRIELFGIGKKIVNATRHAILTAI